MLNLFFVNFLSPWALKCTNQQYLYLFKANLDAFATGFWFVLFKQVESFRFTFASLRYFSSICGHLSQPPCPLIFVHIL